MTDGPRKKEERDSRKESFFREARAIMLSQRQWTDETRLKLRLLAERLKLPPDVYEAALDELSSSEASGTKSRWEEAFIVYLEKQFDKYPGDILTLKAERRAIEYGQRRFQLPVDVCDRLIDHVAERMDIVRISETESIRHAKSEVIRLASGKYEGDDELLEQVVAAVADWGVDEERARQLLAMQLSANRRRRRRRWLQVVVGRSLLAMLGLATIVATLYLGRMISRWELQPEATAPPVVDSRPQPRDRDPRLLPDWWTAAVIRFVDGAPEDLVPSDWRQQVASPSSRYRLAAYQQLLDAVWRLETQGTTPTVEPRIGLSNSGFQSFVIDVFQGEPATENVTGLLEQLNQLRARRTAEDDSPVAALLNNALAGRLIDRIVLRIARSSMDLPAKDWRRAALVAVYPELNVPGGEALERVQENWEDRRRNQLIESIQDRWFQESEAIRWDAALVASYQDTYFSDSQSPVDRRRLQAALVGAGVIEVGLLDDLPAQAEPGEIWLPYLELMMAESEDPDSRKLAQRVRERLPVTIRNEIPKSFSPFEMAVEVGDELSISFPATRLQRQLRIRYVLRLLDTLEVPDVVWSSSRWERRLRANTLALMILESSWDFERFDRLVVGPIPAATDAMGTARTMDDRLVDAVLNAENASTRAQALAALQKEESQGKILSFHQADNLWTAFVNSETASEIQAWRTGMLTLLSQPQMLLSLADRLEAASADTGTATDIREALQSWPELPFDASEWQPSVLRIRALQQTDQIHPASVASFARLTLMEHLQMRTAVFPRGPQNTAWEDPVSGSFQTLLLAAWPGFQQPDHAIDGRFSNVLIFQYGLLKAMESRYSATDKVMADAMRYVRDDIHHLSSLEFNETALSKLLAEELRSQTGDIPQNPKPSPQAGEL